MMTKPATWACAAGIACALSASGALAQAPDNLRIATTSPGSPWNILGVRVGEEMREKYPGLRTSSVSIGGSVANIVAVSRGEAQMAWSVDTAVEEAWEGVEQFPEQIRNFRIVAPFAAVPLQIQIRADSEAQTMEDLARGSIAVGGPGWATTAMNEAVTEAFGYSYDDINAQGGQVHLVGHADWAPMLQDRVADAIFHWGGVPSGVTMAMVENPGIRVLGFSEEERERIMSSDVFERSYVVPITLSSDLYAGIPEDGVDTLAYMSIAVVHEDMDEQFVYEITEAMFGGLITDLYHDGISGSLESVAAVNEMTSVPFHPGAARYFEEQGLTVRTE